MACLGSVVADGVPVDINSLCWTAHILITATMEIDNREARKTDLLNAVPSSLLASYERFTYGLVGDYASNLWNAHCRCLRLESNEYDSWIHRNCK